MALLLDDLFSSVVLTHLIVDVLNSQRALLFTYLSVPLELSNAALGFFNTLYVVAGSILQPVFGYLADHLGPRWMATGGALWLGGFFTLALLTPGQAGLWLLAVASMGSAAFHPAGVMQATLRGQTHFSGRETTSAAFFFVFGQTGYFVGPLLGGPILDHFGPLGLLFLVSLTLPTGLNVGYRLRRAPRVAPAVGAARTVYQPPGADKLSPGPRSTWGQVKRMLPWLAFALLAAFDDMQPGIGHLPVPAAKTGARGRAPAGQVAGFAGLCLLDQPALWLFGVLRAQRYLPGAGSGPGSPERPRHLHCGGFSDF